MIRSDLYGRQTDTQSTRLLADVSQDAAVNVQDQAVDEVGSLGCEEDSGSAQIVCLAPAASGRRRCCSSPLIRTAKSFQKGYCKAAVLLVDIPKSLGTAH